MSIKKTETNGVVKYELGDMYGKYGRSWYLTRAMAEAALHEEWAKNAQTAHRLCVELQALMKVRKEGDTNICDEDLDAIIDERMYDLRNMVWDLGCNGPMTLTADVVEDGKVSVDGEAVTLLVENIAEHATKRRIAASDLERKLDGERRERERHAEAMANPTVRELVRVMAASSDNPKLRALAETMDAATNDNAPAKAKGRKRKAGK